MWLERHVRHWLRESRSEDLILNAHFNSSWSGVRFKKYVVRYLRMVFPRCWEHLILVLSLHCLFQGSFFLIRSFNFEIVIIAADFQLKGPKRKYLDRDPFKSE